MKKIILLFTLLFSLSLKAQNGIDISHHNNLNEKDWMEILNKNVKFVYIKASEGKCFKDPDFKKNYNQAKKYKLLVGAYHFYNDKVPPIAQFNNFVNATKEYKLDLIPVIDFERKGFKNICDKYDRLENLRQLVLLFYDYYKVYPIIYTEYLLYNFTYKEIKSLVNYYWISCKYSFLFPFVNGDIVQYVTRINNKELDYNVTNKLKNFIITDIKNF